MSLTFPRVAHRGPHRRHAAADGHGETADGGQTLGEPVADVGEGQQQHISDNYISPGQGRMNSERAAGLDDPALDTVPVTPAPRRPFVLPALVISDLVAVLAAITIATVIIADYRHQAPSHVLLGSLPYVAIFIPVLSCYGLYRRARRRLVASMFPDLGHLFHALIIGCLLMLLVTGVAHEYLGLPIVHRGAVALAGVLAFVFMPAARAGTRWLLRPRNSKESRLLVVGSGQVAAVVLQRLTNVDGMQVVGCVDDEFVGDGGNRPSQTPLLGTLDDLPRIVSEHSVDHIIVAFSPATGAKLAGLLRSLADHVQISVVPRLFDLLTVRSHVDDLHGLPVVDVAPAALGPADRFAKRGLDIVASATGLLLLSPFLLAIAVAVKLTSPGPVLFRQDRTGRNGTTFRVCKFRTMYVDAEQRRAALAASSETDGPLFKLHDDPRVTKVGSVLRKTSLDELPQLLNVLWGDMSLVGPRPFVTSESAEIAGWAARRFAVRPGMTGLWQISGRSDLPYEELRRLDYSYVASWSLWWDLRILWHTPAAVFRRR